MEEINLKELFEIFWEKKVQMILIIAICAVAGGIYSIGFVTPQYKSSTTLVLVKGNETSAIQNPADPTLSETTTSITATDITLNSKLVSTYSELIKSKSVLRQVISNLGISELEEEKIRKNISVSAVEDTEVIEITVTNENAVYASKIANEIAKVFTDKIAEIYNINNVHIVDEAEVAEGPFNVNHIKSLVIFAFIGIAVAVACVLIANMLDTTVKSAEDIEKNIGLPVLASMPIYDFENAKGGKKK